MKINTYKELTVWQKSMILVTIIYDITEKFPKDEIYGLRSQMQRAVISIPSQIAEGYLRRHRKEYIHFLSISLGSAAELETQILACKSLSKFKSIDFKNSEILIDEIMKMLYVMIKKMEEKAN